MRSWRRATQPWRRGLSRPTGRALRVRSRCMIATGRSIDDWNRENCEAAARSVSKAREVVSGARSRGPLFRASMRASTRCWPRARSTKSRALASTKSRSVAARDEGAWRAVADQADQRRDDASGCDLQAASLIRGTTPSVSSPGSAINSRTGAARRRKPHLRVCCARSCAESTAAVPTRPRQSRASRRARTTPAGYRS